MVHHSGTREIKTDRLLLRRFSESDLHDYFVWTGSAEMSRFIMERPFKDIEEARRELLRIISRYSNADYYMWGIVFENELIGFCCGNEINEDIESVCIGYGIKKKYWNRGITTEATKALIDYFLRSDLTESVRTITLLTPPVGKSC